MISLFEKNKKRKNKKEKKKLERQKKKRKETYFMTFIWHMKYEYEKTLKSQFQYP